MVQAERYRRVGIFLRPFVRLSAFRGVLSRFTCSRRAASLRLVLKTEEFFLFLALAPVHPRCSQRLSAFFIKTTFDQDVGLTKTNFCRPLIAPKPRTHEGLLHSLRVNDTHGCVGDLLRKMSHAQKHLIIPYISTKCKPFLLPHTRKRGQENPKISFCRRNFRQKLIDIGSNESFPGADQGHGVFLLCRNHRLNSSHRTSGFFVRRGRSAQTVPRYGKLA